MRKAVPFLVLVALLAGCGNDKPAATPTPVATATATATDDPLAGYSEGVRKYYAGADLAAADDPNADAEVKYFQPPRPAEAKVGETITLTGGNIGVQTDVTVTKVDSIEVGGKPFTAVSLELDNDAGGMTVFESEIKSAQVLDSDGKPVPVAKRGIKAPCSNGFDDHVPLDVGEKAHGCLLFAGTDPKQFQLALEAVPVDAGGIWKLR
jgi:hypothetical protein